MSSRRPSTQLSLAARGRRGGFRLRAGRKRMEPEDRKGHHPRPGLASRFPVHVTLKVRPGVASLRRGPTFRVLERCFRLGKDKFGFRLVHFTAQGNHLHLLVEAKDKVALSRGMQGLAIRVARRLNAKLGRTGKLFAERYHQRILRSPTEVRRALVYVLNNSRRHAAPGEQISRNWIDPQSSAPWFEGWRWRPREPWFHPEGEAPVAPPSTWLLQEGWQRAGGLLRPDETPGGGS
jgi:REP element-mobilizing transposase RayT